jgi:DNA replication protein DnaC
MQDGSIGGSMPHGDDEGRLISASEALERGLVDKEPEPIPCEYCGKMLEPLGVMFRGRLHWVSHVECGCEGEARELELRREEEERESRRRAGIAAERAGIPARFAQASPTVDACLLYAREFGRDTDTGLYIHGPVGTGKTHNAAAIARIVSEKGYDVIFTSALTIFSNIKDTWDTGRSAKLEMSRYLDCRLLVLDDLGKELSSRWALATLFELVNSRYEEMKPVVITSQYPPEGLRRRIASSGERETADAIASRLSETCLEIALHGDDRRRSGGQPRGKSIADVIRSSR